MLRIRLQFGLKVFLLLPLIVAAFFAGWFMSRQHLLAKHATAQAEAAESRLVGGEAYKRKMRADLEERLDRSMLQLDRVDSNQRLQQLNETWP